MTMIRLALLTVLVLPVAGCNPESTSPTAALSPVTQPTAEAKNKGIPPGATLLDLPLLSADTGDPDPDAPETFSTTESGIQYRILRKSDGRKPTLFSSVIVDYRGWLDNGQQFDSSYNKGEPASFPLNGVVKGWQEGLQLIGEGGMIELWIPGELGYGENGTSGIPANASLHFVVELQEVN